MNTYLTVLVLGPSQMAEHQSNQVAMLISTTPVGIISICSSSYPVAASLSTMSSDIALAKVEKVAQAGIVDVENASESLPIERNVTGVFWLIVNLAVLSAKLLYALDNIIMANVRPSVLEEFGKRVDTLTWLPVSYPMGEVGANPLWYTLSKLFTFLCSVSDIF